MPYTLFLSRHASFYLYSHVVFAPSAHNLYEGGSFPGLVDALYAVQHSDKKDWDQVKKELSIAVFYIESATNVLLLESI